MKIAIYIHVPFCLQRCTYCDFNTYTGLLHLRPAYAEALKQEILLIAGRYKDLIATTLYFGGGTPSLLALDSAPGIIHEVRRHFSLPDGAEITLEANPGTVDEVVLTALRRAGANRLSFGVQSAHDDELRMLGRIHAWADVVETVRAARTVGFDNLNLDLIFGLPKQTLRGWEETLMRVLALEPEHLSLYALTLEPGTPLAEAVALGELPAPDPDLAAEMYEAASERLLQAGFWQYEISNWARTAHGSRPPEDWALPPEGCSENIGPWICRHNLTYWRNRPWLGLGAGAYSWFRQRRWGNLPHPGGYIQSVRTGRLKRIDEEAIPAPLERGETMMMGLRLAEGVTETRFRKRFGLSIGEIYSETLAQLVETGLLDWDGFRARLSARGRLLGNQVFGAFLPEDPMASSRG